MIFTQKIKKPLNTHVLKDEYIYIYKIEPSKIPTIFLISTILNKKKKKQTQKQKQKLFTQHKWSVWYIYLKTKNYYLKIFIKIYINKKIYKNT